MPVFLPLKWEWAILWSKSLCFYFHPKLGQYRCTLLFKTPFSGFLACFASLHKTLLTPRQELLPRVVIFLWCSLVFSFVVDPTGPSPHSPGAPGRAGPDHAGQRGEQSLGGLTVELHPWELRKTRKCAGARIKCSLEPAASVSGVFGGLLCYYYYFNLFYF